MDRARRANERRKENKSRSQERAQMDEDTVSLEPDEEEDFFDQQSTKKISKAHQDHSSSGTKRRMGPSPGHTSPLPWEQGVELPSPSISVGSLDMPRMRQVCRSLPPRARQSSTSSQVELSPSSRSSSRLSYLPVLGVLQGLSYLPILGVLHGLSYLPVLGVLHRSSYFPVLGVLHGLSYLPILGVLHGLSYLPVPGHSASYLQF